MLKRTALLIAATAVLAIPASSAFAAPQRPAGALPEELCFAAYPWPAQPALCGVGNGEAGKA